MSDLRPAFGATRHLPQSYVLRHDQETRLSEALAGEGHLVVWGEPRQGKSALLRHQLPPGGYCVVQCAYGHKRYDVYRMLLRQAGLSVAVERKRKRSRGIAAKVSFLSGDTRSDSETTEREIDIDISNVNDVLAVVATSGFQKIVVLEDFHCLGRNAQRDIVQDLKVVYEKSPVRVILVGAWADRGTLLALPAGLSSHLKSLEVPRWTEDDLYRVVDAGAAALHVTIERQVAHRLVACAQGSVGLLQDLARLVCDAADSGRTGPRTRALEAVDSAVNQLQAESIGRLRWYLRALVSARIMAPAPRKLFEWIAHTLLVASDDDLHAGLLPSAVLAEIKRLYPHEAAGLTETVLLRGLSELEDIHRSLQATPLIGYDSNEGRLHVIDPVARLCFLTATHASLIQYLPDKGRDMVSEGAGAYADFQKRTLARYGTTCAICSVKNHGLITIRQIADLPSGNDTRDPALALPLCLNHATAWANDLVRIEPGTTRILCEDPSGLNITRSDLRHLPIPPDDGALRSSWEGSALKFRLHRSAQNATAVLEDRPEMTGGID